MSSAFEAAAIIHTLESNRFYTQCPSCEEAIALKDAGLFYLDDFTEEAAQIYKQGQRDLADGEKALRDRRKHISQSSESGAKAVNIGFVLERIAPTLQGFHFDRNDCRSLFDPIDYVIFEGLSRKGSVSRLLFVDIKTGGAKLKANQKEIRSLVERKKVAWATYHPEGQ